MAITQFEPSLPGQASVLPGVTTVVIDPALARVRTARGALASVTGMLDQTAVRQPGRLRDVLIELTQLEAQVAAAKLRVLTLAERAKVPAESGMSDVGAWAARVTNQDAATTSRDAKLARRLTSNESTLGASATGEALAQGRVSKSHCDVIANALDRLPHQITPDKKAAVEGQLLDQATELTPNQLRRVARRALAAIEPDPHVVDEHEDTLLRDEEHAAIAKTRFKLWDNHDGTTSGSFTVPTLQAASLRKVLDAMASPRRARLGATNAQGDGIRRDDPERFDKLNGQAFAELIERLPTDHLAKPNVTVLVTMTLESLRGKLTAAGVDNAEGLSASEARRIACGAGLVPAVLGGKSRVLDLGRTQRLFSESQRQALALQHETCAADGCERPFAWCELHHRQPWSHLGNTDLDDAIPLCWFHHRRIHDQTYAHQAGPDGQIRFARARRC